jgi:hypothetical protein
MTCQRPLTRTERLRRVVKLCIAFARNLAYYRVGQDQEHQDLFDPEKTPSANFWCVANSNSIDICVLGWCKLFADEHGKHYWGKIVTDPTAFKAALLVHLVLDEAGFQEKSRTIRHYRDKFLAHLDSDRTMNIPFLDMAQAAVWFYHAYVVAHEAEPGGLRGLPMDLTAGYQQSEEEARAVLLANRDLG